MIRTLKPDIPFYDRQLIEESGAGGFEMYRIPVLVTPGGGVLVLFYLASNPEGQTLFMRRSRDGGRTWSDRVAVVEGSRENYIHNPVAVAEQSGNTVHFLWCRGHRQCFYRRSVDAGLTWSSTQEITYVFESFLPYYHWCVCAAGPGHGIQLRSGRLVVPVWMSAGAGHRPSVASTIYSDNNGATWSCGQILKGSEIFVNPNETTVAELSYGGVLASFRHESLKHRRAFATSPDGASGWDKVTFHEQLKDPICHASLARFEGENDTDGGLLLSNCDWEDEAGIAAKSRGEKLNWSEDARQRLTVSCSHDDGLTWPQRRLLERQAGYSDLTFDRAHQMVLCFYESGWMKNSCILTKSLAIARFNFEWLNYET